MSHYKPYPSYKDSGIEWIGEVPEHWEVKQLKFIVSCNDEALSDKTPGSTQISYVDISSVSYDKGIESTESLLFENAPSRARRKAKFGDVIVSTVRTYLKAVASIDEKYSDCVFSTGFAVLRARDEKLQTSFLKWLVLNDLFIQAIESHSEGLSYPAINSTALINLKVVVPALEDQVELADILDRETTRIDTLIAKKTRFIELLKEKRQALITHAVTKGLDRNAKMKDSGIEWIGQVPEHWKIAQIKRISALNPRKSTLSEEKDSLCTFLPMEKLRTNAVTLDETRPIHEVYGGYSYFCDGDILIAKVTPCFENGNIAVANGLVNGIGFGSTEINVLRVNGKGHNRFLYYRLQEEQFRTIAKSEMRGTGGLKRVPTDLFESFTIGLPDTDEQATIVATLDRETARIDALISKAEQSITLLKERRAAFITAAVTGEIDLRGKQ